MEVVRLRLFGERVTLFKGITCMLLPQPVLGAPIQHRKDEKQGRSSHPALLQV